MADPLIVDTYDSKFDEDDDELSMEFANEDGKKVFVQMSAEQAEEFILELYQLLGLDERDDDED